MLFISRKAIEKNEMCLQNKSWDAKVFVYDTSCLPRDDDYILQKNNDLSNFRN